PAKSGQRRTTLESFRADRHTVVVYEAPHRIRETLEDIVAVLGPSRPVVIARQLTKISEEFIRGTAKKVLSHLQDRGVEIKGEITLLIGAGESRPAASHKNLAERLHEIMREQKLDDKRALKILAKEQGLSKSEVYRELQRAKSRKEQR